MAVAAPTAIGVPARPEPAGRLVAWAYAAPDLIAVAVAGFALPAMLLLICGHYEAALVLPLGVLGAVVAVVVCRVPKSTISRTELVCTLIALGLLVVWCVYNMAHNAQDVFTERDPATYDVAGRWLMDHASLKIPIHAEIFGHPQGTDSTAAGFGANPDGSLYAQGDHLLPALIAVFGWVFGVGGLLKANVVFGALALFTFYGLARRIVGGPLALVAMSALAVSIPMIYVSRDTYSETLALLLLMGGLGLLYRAFSHGRTADFALAGFVAGMSASARIDSNVSLLSLILVAAVLLALAPPRERRRAAARAGALVAGALPMVLLGWLDVTRLASGYYRDERHQILPIGYAAVALAGLAAGFVALMWRPRVRAVLATRAAGRWLSGIAGLITLVAFAVLASRPLWMTVRGGGNSAVAAAQKLLGLPLDPTRLYYEHSVAWQAMYYGWVAVGLAAVGYILLLDRLIRAREYALLGALAMGGAMSALYLWNAQITPDQPWAMRRFVPVVIPMLLLAGAYALRAAWRTRAVWLRAVTVAGAVALILVPADVTRPVRGLREAVPQLAQITAVCKAIGPSGAVVAVDSRARESYQQTLRSYCNVPAIGLIGATPAQLAALRASVAAHGRTLYAMALDPSRMRFVTGTGAQPLSSIRATKWPSTLDTVPTAPRIEPLTVYLGSVRPDGLLVPIAPPSR